MLMVIFGAGASYDSDPNPDNQPPKMTGVFRPPLAHELFQATGNFLAARNRYPACHSIVGLLQHSSEGYSFEQRMQELQEEAEEYPERHRQLAAVRFYLQTMLWDIQQHWLSPLAGVSNYKTLLDQIDRRRKPGELVCLVTFNYDTLLEYALEDANFACRMSFREITDYTASDDYKVFKVHGSVNWGRVVNTFIAKVDRLGADGMANELINRAATLDVSNTFVKLSKAPMEPIGQAAVFPAIALPVASKSKFECPQEQMDLLSSLIPHVTKLLLVGWRGNEQHFLKLLAKRLGREKLVQCFAIAKNRDEAQKTLERLGAEGIKREIVGTAGGFTAAVVNRLLDPFLRR